MVRNKNTPITSERIGKLRTAAGESQQELADKLEVKRETVKFWESGERQIKAVDIARLALHFDVSADYLLGLVDVPTREIELQNICRYTGLSDKTVLTLSGLKTRWPESIEIIEDFMAEYGSMFVLHALQLKEVATSFNPEFERVCASDAYQSAEEKYKALQVLKGSLQLAAFGFSEMCREVANCYGVYDYMQDVDAAIYELFETEEYSGHGEHQKD